ncbi:hypothetical protein ACFQH6_16175 [Halobacteriaceae archaeon GCM10025711]
MEPSPRSTAVAYAYDALLAADGRPVPAGEPLVVAQQVEPERGRDEDVEHPAGERREDARARRERSRDRPGAEVRHRRPEPVHRVLHSRQVDERLGRIPECVQAAHGAEFLDADGEQRPDEQECRHRHDDDGDGGGDSRREHGFEASVQRPHPVVDEHAEDERADERVQHERHGDADDDGEQPPADPGPVECRERGSHSPG